MRKSLINNSLNSMSVILNFNSEAWVNVQTTNCFLFLLSIRIKFKNDIAVIFSFFSSITSSIFFLVRTYPGHHVNLYSGNEKKVGKVELVIVLG